MWPQTSSPEIKSEDSQTTDVESRSPTHRRSRSEHQPSPHASRARSQSVHTQTLHSPPLRLSISGTDKQLYSSDDSTEQRHVSAGPTTSDSPFGPLSSGATDRVFPIRSVVSVDPTSTPYHRPEGGGDGFPGMVLPNESGGGSVQRSDSHRHSITSISSAGQASDTSIVDTPLQPLRSRGNIPLSRGYGRFSSSPIASEARKGSGPAVSDVERMGGLRQMSIFGEGSSIRSESVGSGAGERFLPSKTEDLPSTSDTAGGIYTARFKHVFTEGGHAVITGRDGHTLQRCEDEPIHIPGAVQGFGLLVALNEEVEGKLLVRIVSENSERIIGYTSQQLFGLESFCDILSEEQTDNLFDHLQLIRDEESNVATNGPEVFTLSIRPPKRKTQKLWCAMHINKNNPDLIICEFELEDDQINPLVPIGEATPEPPEDTLHSNPTPEELAESTVNSSRPLRMLRNARKRKGEAAAMEVFNIMSQVQEQLASAPTLESFLKVLVGVVKELTGFHRVMIYQFDSSWNGRVVTELVDPRATKDLYKGLNFPASDIPKQARDMYKFNKVRLLYDRDQETARLVCRTVKDLETPIDLTYAYLRAMSPIHIKYLANMAVRSSMSISINAFDELWGLIALHGYGAKGMRVSFPIRKMCRMIGDSASRNIERLSYASRLQARKLINTSPTEHNPSGYIIASSDDLLKLFDADYGLLSIRDETKILGKLEQTQEALALLEYMRLRKITSVLSSTDLRVDFPDLRYPPGFSVIAGLLLVPLTVSGNDFIVFFRRGQLREVKWAGNPYEKFLKEGTEGYLEPRKSFKMWRETIHGKCREWSEEQIETAAVLCLVYGKFIEVWRQKEVALQNSELTRLLLANSAHEVRTPLNAIINYLEIAMEGSLDQETRENLTKSHSASKSLIYVINDLLDLTKTEEGRDLIKDDVFDFPETVREATDMFKGDAKRKQIDYEVIEHPGVPKLVIGDQRRVRQAISNLTANAIQHTNKGSVRIELWLAEGREDHAEIDIVIQDTGVGMSSKKLDALFRDLEQVQSETDEGLQEKLAPSTEIATQGNQETKTLGLGLAVVARVIRNMNGQLRLKSEEGKGSRFVIQLGFDLPQVDEKQKMIEGSTMASIGPPDNQPTTPPVSDGEVLLVNKSAQRPSTAGLREVVRRASRESIESANSMNSKRSFRSVHSAKSEVDRLIDAIQEPVMTSMPSSSRPASRGNRGDGGPSIMSPRLSLSRTPTTSSNIVGVESDASTRAPSHLMEKPGQASVMDSGTPIRPVRVPEDPHQGYPASESLAPAVSRMLFETPDKQVDQSKTLTADKLRVLVAEDDPINSRIIQKRLEKFGHIVYLTINGEECSSAYGEKAAFFDVVLMDMQVS